MDLKVRFSGGVVVEYGDQGVVLDPTRGGHGYPAFVTHAHADHAYAFKSPELSKYATVETARLLGAMGWRRLENLEPVAAGGRVALGDVEVRVHNSGHVLGSVMYEVQTPGGSVLYTGDLCTESTFTMDPAPPVECDILVVETTFGAPMFSFPKREEVAVDVYNWAVNTVLGGSIPVFKTDSIGNAQEIISILNQYTNLPAVTAKSATPVTGVYRDLGYSLDSVDSRSPEGQDLIASGKCAVVAPKGSKVAAGNTVEALASGWAILMGKRRTAFPLSDHADYRGLMGYVRRCRPRRVLTFHGGSMTKDFHKHVRNSLGIPAAPLTSRVETIAGPQVSNESRIKACSGMIVRAVKIPGFVYQPSWLVREMGRQGFTPGETQSSIELLLERGVLRGAEGGVSLG